MSEMIRLECARCGFNGHVSKDYFHQCIKVISLDEYERLKLNAEQAEARAEAMAKDAGRYQWLRHHTTGQSDARGRQEFDMPDPHPLGNIMQGSVAQHLDAAIDTAIEQGAQRG